MAQKRTIVLVHGAWHGGWCWQRVVRALAEHGHDVVAPTLTGVSDRAHLLSPLVGLTTHIEDVVRLVDVLEGDIVLVGHSYAGMVISGVCGRRPDRIAHRIHLDAFVPREGESAIELLPEQVQHHYVESVSERGWGWMIPPRSLEVLGVTDPEHLSWLTPRLTPQPWLTYTEPLGPGLATTGIPSAFIECVDWMRVFRPQADRARDLGWDVREIETGHEAMVTAPDRLAHLLLEVLEG